MKKVSMQTSLRLHSDKPASVYLRTTSRLRADASIVFAQSTRIYLMGESECTHFLHDITKKNVFLRIRRHGDFYYRRINALAGHTVVEVTVPGTPKEIITQATIAADLAEHVVLLAESILTKRAAFLRLLGISAHRKEQIGLVRSADRMTLRSATKPGPRESSVSLTKKLIARVAKLGFDELFEAAILNTSLARRLRLAVDWLVESRCEPRFEAAVVKTAIALETLLTFSDKEALSRSLSERMAFLLSPDPVVRADVSKAIKRFYEVRSGVVHGGKRRKVATEDMLDGVDRLAILVLLKLAVNRAQLSTDDDLQQWLDEERWRNPSELKQSFPASFLHDALELAGREAT